MRVAIMQPYFLPYIGYFQLMHAVDRFVLYDNIEYTKKGWINRNRILVNGADQYITLPLAAGPDHAHVRDRALAATFPEERGKILRRVQGAYAKAPHFADGYAMLERIMATEERGLFNFIRHSLDVVRAHIGIDTPIVVSSTLPEEPGLRGEERVLGLCKAMGATTYINPIGGVGLYDKAHFAQQGVQLHFLRPGLEPYGQFNAPFVPGLSILDVVMFNPVDQIRAMLADHDLE